MDQPADPSPPPAITDQPNHDINVDFARDLLAATFETMSVRMNENPAYRAVHEAATCTALKSMHARDPIELMFAAHVVASHHATMECFRRAMRATDNADVASRMHRNAVLLSRMMADGVKTLERRQAPAASGQDRQNSIRGGKTP